MSCRWDATRLSYPRRRYKYGCLLSSASYQAPRGWRLIAFRAQGTQEGHIKGTLNADRFSSGIAVANNRHSEMHSIRYLHQ